MTAEASPVDVLVVGGGPAGSATASRLARAGWRVRLLDRARFPREKPCSEYMSPETVRHLDALGVLPALEATPHVALDGTAVRGPSGNRLQGSFARAGGAPFRSTGLAIARRVLDAALLEAARQSGVAVQESTRVVELLHEGGGVAGVVAGSADGTLATHRARIVIGADGLHSVVARRAGLHRPGRLRRMAFVAHVDGVAGMGPRAELHVGRDGYIGLNPIGDGVTNVAVVVPLAIAQSARGDARAFFLRQLAGQPGTAGRIPADRIVRDVIAVGPFDARSRRTTADGILLVGDAAEFFDPFTGEGIGTALAGAEMAARVLDAALAHPGPVRAPALTPYRTLRRQAFLGKWMVERMIGYGMLAPGLFDRAIGRLDRRGLADTLIGVTGAFVSPWRVMNPVFLARMVV